jgi:hypothetical protein
MIAVPADPANNIWNKDFSTIAETSGFLNTVNIGAE